MAIIGNSKGYSKKDINFFDEFTATARKQAQMLFGFILICLAVIAIFVVWFVVTLFHNIGIKNDIKDKEAKLNSDAYIGLDIRAQELAQQITERNQYLFSLSQMRKTVDLTNPAETEIADLLGVSIPDDSYINAYEITGDTLTISGMSLTYDGAVNMVAVLNDSDCFATTVAPIISVERNNDVTTKDREGNIASFIDPMYAFSISGNLTNKVMVSIAFYASTETGTIALGAIDTTAYDYNSVYSLPGVASRSYNGVDYTLTGVNVNGSAVSSEVLANIIATNVLEGRATSNVEITLYYSVQMAETEGSEE